MAGKVNGATQIELDKLRTELSDKIDAAKLPDYNALLDRLTALEDTVRHKSARIELLESTIAVQPKTIDLLRSQFQQNKFVADNTDQYIKRTNLRIHGIHSPPASETADDVVAMVKEIGKDRGVDIDDNDIFRAHRVGKVITEKTKQGKPTGRKLQTVIVRFRSWHKRCEFYKARPKSNDSQPKPGVRNASAPKYHSFGLDLSKPTRDLLEIAQEAIKAKFPVQEDDSKIFAFADINCNLSVKQKNNKFAYFRTEDEFMKILNAN